MMMQCQLLKNQALSALGGVVALVGALSWVGAPAHAQTPQAGAGVAPAAGVPAGCPALLQHTFARLQDEKPQSLCQYQGKVLLVVNTASFCGFTPQYQGLEALFRRYQSQGLVVLGFPSNDFSQEKGSNQEIAAFCENTFNVKFPMFAKSHVTGEEVSPFYRQLAQLGGQAPKWNFYKYLIGRDGRVVGSYASQQGPDDAALVKAIEQQLAAAPRAGGVAK